ncbi:OmpP1/FadL family transporter [Candidatus Neomarinimicrobiota bacterium]
MRYKTALLILLSFSFLSAQIAWDAARPFVGLGGPGARANGLGQAFTGVADDATALFYNPAGLAHLTRTEFDIGFDHLSVTTDVREASASQSATITATRLNNAAFTFPIEDAKMTAAVGYQMVRAFERKRDLPGTPIIEDFTEEGKLGIWSMGLGYQISTKAAVGIGVDVLRGRNTYTEPIDNYVLEPTYTGLGASVGLLLSPIPAWRIGLLMRSPQSLQVDEEERYDGTVTREYKTRSSYSLRMGSSLMAGPLLLTADVFWFDYSQIRFDSDLEDSAGYIEIPINQEIRSDYISTLGYAVGVEMLLPIANTKLRAGHRMDPNYERGAPAEMNQQTLAMGLSVVPVPQLKLDAALSLTTWQRHLDVDQREETSVTNVTISFIYRF